MKKRKPWGFFAGLCGIAVFYLTVALVAATMILDRIEAETSGNATIFATWWQTLLFVLDVAFALGIAAFVAIGIVGRKKRAKAAEVKGETV